ncbi:MAG: carbohydrate binding family 9 domain-containing protein [Gemmatimonadetes bacterium]|nr:carbohydrate binding family 9 domain-containing protein [Gemmatimonadota bacterium]
MVLFTAVTALAVAIQIQAQQPAPAPEPGPATAGLTRTVVAERAAAEPVIDGRNTDAVWRTAVRESGFRQWDPLDNAPPSFETEFQVAYDEWNLYVYVRAHDPHPDSIMRALSRRDVRGPSDQIVVFVDSYNDRRTGFQFAINPDGVKRDYAVYNDGHEDGSWNGVWEVATVVDSLGWAAEFRIPLSQLRYADGDSHTFGFGVFRDIERYKERIGWPLISRNVNGMASQMGTLTGLEGITSSRSLELTPYTVAQSETRAADAGGFERAQKLTLGADLKFRITPNVTLDATVNPDFGQVEADPAVLNLGAFETFLGERRPFFVEGTGLYRFALNCYIVVDCSTNEGLFYSRRIGRSPFLRNAFGNASTPTSTPIATAAKLTGRTGGGLSFGFLDAVTQHVEGADGATVEPRTNYAVVSAEQDLRGGEAGVRLIATGVNRALDDWTRPYAHSSAYATGLSVRNRMFGGKYEIAGSLAASRIEGSPEAIAATQANAVHYYQQPSDDLELDPARTTLSGHAEQLKFGKYAGGIVRFETSFVRQSAGFDVNDLGYLRRADQQDWSTWASLRFNTPRGPYRWLQVNGNHWQTWNTSGTRLQTAFNGNAHMGLHNNWNLHAGGTVDGLGETYCDRCTRGGPVLRRSRGIFPWFGVNGDNRRTIVPSMWVNLGYNDDGHTRSVRLNPSVNMQISTGLQANVGAAFSHNQNATQWFGNFSDQGVTHYSFAHLDQRTVSMNLRVNYTARPDLSFQLYAEPFVSTGTYSDIRELSATPDASEYADRFTSYTPPAGASTGFNFRQLRTNAVARWEYMPGSTLFVVWAHGRQDSGQIPSDRTWTAEYRDLLELHPDNTFLVKVAYWFNR